ECEGFDVYRTKFKFGYALKKSVGRLARLFRYVLEIASWLASPPASPVVSCRMNSPFVKPALEASPAKRVEKIGKGIVPGVSGAKVIPPLTARFPLAFWNS